MLPYKMEKLCSKLQHIKELFYNFTFFIHDGPSICYIYLPMGEEDGAAD